VDDEEVLEEQKTTFGLGLCIVRVGMVLSLFTFLTYVFRGERWEGVGKQLFHIQTQGILCAKILMVNLGGIKSVRSCIPTSTTGGSSHGPVSRPEP